MRRKNRKGFSWRLAAGLLCGAVFLVSMGMAARNLLRSHQEQGAYTALAQQVRDTASLLESAVEPGASFQAPRLEAYAQLHQENPDMAGWISIPGTSVDYPVMYTPQEPEYYLRRAFDGSSAVSGSIFVGEGSQPEGNHVILYGHNMDDGSMFADLLDYAQEGFAEDHSTVLYDTLEEQGEYQVLGAFYSKAYGQREEGVFRYYQYTDLSDPQAFQEYVDQVRRASLFQTQVDPQYGDRLITLSTCSYHTGEGRFVVVACQCQ